MNDLRNIFVLENFSEMSDFMVEKWESISGESIQRKGYFVAALSGGRTPVDFYRKLADFKGTLFWGKTHIFFADERCVSFGDKDSNYGMLAVELLNRIEIPRSNCHPVPVEEFSPEIAAIKYEEDLRIFFGLSPSEFPEFDLVVLGIGEDGHTASLFPRSEGIRETGRLVVAVSFDRERHDRVTLTLPVINSAKNVIFLASGKNKSAVVKEVIEKKDSVLPAALVKPERGNLLFVLDSGAGSDLSVAANR